MPESPFSEKNCGWGYGKNPKRIFGKSDLHKKLQILIKNNAKMGVFFGSSKKTTYPHPGFFWENAKNEFHMTKRLVGTQMLVPQN